MELTRAIRSRRMVRSFGAEPVDKALIAEMLEDACKAPSAGGTPGRAFVVLSEPGELEAFWHTTTTPGWLDTAEASGLCRAPVIVVVLASPARYEARYAQPAKAASRGRPGSLSGIPAAAWPVPYWYVDAAFATMTLLLRVTDAGLGALFFRLHAGVERLLESLGAPVHERWAPIGAVAIGHAAQDVRRPSRTRAGSPATHFEAGVPLKGAASAEPPSPSSQGVRASATASAVHWGHWGRLRT